MIGIYGVGAYEANGEVANAIALLEDVVAIRKQTLAETHPDRLASEASLRICCEMSRLEDASPEGSGLG